VAIRTLRRLLIAAGLSFSACGSYAQPALPSQSDPDYFLLQSFAAAGPDARFALNHIGIEGQQTESGYMITTVLDASPAQQAGLQAGDIILSANGEAFHPITSLNPQSDTQGRFLPLTAVVKLSISRAGESQSVSISPVFDNLFNTYRNAIPPSVQNFSLGNKTVAYLHLWGLSRSSHDLLTYREIISDLVLADGLILDLRHAYGYLHADLLHALVSDTLAQTVSQELDIGNELFPYYESYSKPIAVLINGKTRGGAERLAWALQQSSQVVSIGEATAGASREVQLDNGELIYKPGDADTPPVGAITPHQNIEYLLPPSTRSDPHFNAAIDALLGII